MTIRDVLILGRIELITKTNQVSFPLNNETIEEINDIKDTFLNFSKSAGLAANQIGINKQIIITRLPNYNHVVLINPKIDICSTEKEYEWEGCLSIPSLRAVVPRYSSIYVSGYDEDGVLHENQASHFFARNIQRNIDYLNGITLFHRVQDSKLISFKSELQYGILDDSKAVLNSMGDIP